MYDTSDIRKGLKVLMDGNPFTVIEFQFVKPGKGQAFTRVKVKSLTDGAVLERTYKSGEKIEKADVEERAMQYIYPDGENFVFMHEASGDQITVAGHIRRLRDVGFGVSAIGALLAVRDTPDYARALRAQRTVLVDEAEVEHDSARVLIQQLRRLRPGDDKYAATFHVLAEYVRHHMKEEESRLFRKLTRSAMDWPQLLDDMLVRRRELMDELGPGGDALHDDRVLRMNFRSEIRQ